MFVGKILLEDVKQIYSTIESDKFVDPLSAYFNNEFYCSNLFSRLSCNGLHRKNILNVVYFLLTSPIILSTCICTLASFLVFSTSMLFLL